jgi:translation initiation factor IF-2
MKFGGGVGAGRGAETGGGGELEAPKKSTVGADGLGAGVGAAGRGVGATGGGSARALGAEIGLASGWLGADGGVARAGVGVGGAAGEGGGVGAVSLKNDINGGNSPLLPSLFCGAGGAAGRLG